MSNQDKFKQLVEKEKELVELTRVLENKKAEYKAFTKEWVGVADNETISISKVIEMVLRLSNTEELKLADNA